MPKFVVIWESCLMLEVFGDWIGYDIKPSKGWWVYQSHDFMPLNIQPWAEQDVCLWRPRRSRGAAKSINAWYPNTFQSTFCIAIWPNSIWKISKNSLRWTAKVGCSFRLNTSLALKFLSDAHLSVAVASASCQAKDDLKGLGHSTFHWPWSGMKENNCQMQPSAKCNYRFSINLKRTCF